MNENKKIFLQIMNDNSDIAIATSIDIYLILDM